MHIQYKENTMEHVVEKLISMIQDRSVSLERQFSSENDLDTDIVHFPLSDENLSSIVMTIFEEGDYPEKDGRAMPIMSVTQTADKYYDTDIIDDMLMSHFNLQFSSG